MGKYYGKEIIIRVLELKAEGKTHREIGEQYNLSKEQIKGLLRRHKENERKNSIRAIAQPPRSSKNPNPYKRTRIRA